MKQKRKIGFTLIELIVVMAIIAILVLIAAPKFMGYTEKAKLTKTINNIKAAERASELYYMDNDGWPKQPTEYTAAQLNTWVEEFKSISGDTVVLDIGGKYYDVDWNLMKGFMDKPDNNFKYIIQNPVGDIYYAYKLTPSGEQTKFAGDNQVTTEPEPTTEANLAPTAVITITPETNLDSDTSIVWSYSNSTDPESDNIVSAIWTVDGVETTELPSKLNSGIHNITLKVQDSNGNWSSIVNKSITVSVPRIPELVSSSDYKSFIYSTNFNWGYYPPSYLFNNLFSDYGEFSGKTGYAGVEFSSPKILKKYKLYQNTLSVSPTCSYGAWTFEGSNNGTTWNILDTQVGQTFAKAESREYSFSNTEAYSFYRIKVTNNNGATGYTYMSEIHFFE